MYDQFDQLCCVAAVQGAGFGVAGGLPRPNPGVDIYISSYLHVYISICYPGVHVWPGGSVWARAHPGRGVPGPAPAARHVPGRARAGARGEVGHQALVLSLWSPSLYLHPDTC